MFATIICFALAADAPSSTRPAAQAPDVSLTLTANNSQLLQRDNLLLRAVIENPRKTELEVAPPSDHAGAYHLTIELRDGATWRRLRTIAEDTWGGHGYGTSGPLIVSEKSSYAEYNWFQRDHKKFIFEEPGRYQLRAVAKVDNKELHSDPIVVTVGKRPADDLRRLEAAMEQLHELGFRTLQWDLPEKVLALEELGGNIGMTLRNFRMLQQWIRTNHQIDGQHIPKEEFPDFLFRRLDAVSAAAGLNLVSSHFIRIQDPEALFHTVQGMPIDCSARRNADSQLKKYGLSSKE